MKNVNWKRNRIDHYWYVGKVRISLELYLNTKKSAKVKKMTKSFAKYSFEVYFVIS